MMLTLLMYSPLIIVAIFGFLAILVIFSDDEPLPEKKSHHRKTKHKISHKHAH